MTVVNTIALRTPAHEDDEWNGGLLLSSFAECLSLVPRYAGDFGCQLGAALRPWRSRYSGNIHGAKVSALTAILVFSRNWNSGPL